MKTYRVTYEIKGTRVVDVTIKDTAIPYDWHTLKTEEQDEILYERQEYSVLHLEDLDYGKAVFIDELKKPEVVR